MRSVLGARCRSHVSAKALIAAWLESKNAVQFWLNGVLIRKDLAATYSRGTYRTTTIGNAVFDGRVRDGIGSGHSFMATKK